jgi:hypothetical protein
MPDGAYYLAGYAVGCALKSCIAKETRRYEVPRQEAGGFELFTLRDLVKVANLEIARNQRAGQSREFGNNWDTVQAWSEQSRYQRHRPEAAKHLLTAVADRRYG